MKARHIKKLRKVIANFKEYEVSYSSGLFGDFGVKAGESLTDEFIKKCTVHDSLSQVYHDAEDWANENITNLSHFSVDISC